MCVFYLKAPLNFKAKFFSCFWIPNLQRRISLMGAQHPVHLYTVGWKSEQERIDTPPIRASLLSKAIISGLRARFRKLLNQEENWRGHRSEWCDLIGGLRAMSPTGDELDSSGVLCLTNQQAEPTNNHVSWWSSVWIITAKLSLLTRGWWQLTESWVN